MLSSVAQYLRVAGPTTGVAGSNPLESVNRYYLYYIKAESPIQFPVLSSDNILFTIFFFWYRIHTLGSEVLFLHLMTMLTKLFCVLVASFSKSDREGVLSDVKEDDSNVTLHWAKCLLN